MIHEISIENFYSIRERITLDFRVAANAPALARFPTAPSRVDTRLPTVIAFFGANASGKSTVLRAVTSAVRFAANSFDLAPEAPIPHFMPFLHKQWWNRPTRIAAEFDAYWIDDKPQTFRYELSVQNEEPRGPSCVLHEALSYAPQGRFRRLFERKAEAPIYLAHEFELSSRDSILRIVRRNASVLSTLAKLNNALATRVCQDLNRLQSNLWGLSRRPLELDTVARHYATQPETLERMNRQIRRFDIGVSAIEVSRGEQGPFLLFRHGYLDEPLLAPEESHGTQHFVKIFPVLDFALQTGVVALLDEFDSDLHSALIPELLSWFQQPETNPLKAQLIVSAHNATILDTALEKEEVFVVEKNSDGSTCVHAAADIRGLRREPSLLRKYLGGALGGLPHIG